MVKKTVLLFLFAVNNLVGQNLIPNWSFEDTIPCAINPNFGGPESAPPWFTAKQTPDYISLNYCGVSGIPYGYQIPKSGIAMIGFTTFVYGVVNGGRECFESILNDTLLAGHSYCVNAYASLADQCKFATNNIGALFTDSLVTNNAINNFTLIPQINSSNIISDTLNWINISGNFIAVGGEHYITIGNFYSDVNTIVDSSLSGNVLGSYCYIDDISIIDCTTGLNELQNSLHNLSFETNPVKENLSFIYDLTNKKNGVLEVYDVLGKKVLQAQLNKSAQQKITISFLNAGVYYCKLLADGKQEAVGRFVKEE